MKIDIYDSQSIITECTVPERKIITELTSARPHGFQFAKSFKRKQWDGWISLLKSNTFPTGLLKRVLGKLPDAELTDYRKPLREGKVVEILANGYKLRPYQTEAVSKVMTTGNGVLKMSPNAGKTLIAASLYLSLGKPLMLVVVTNIELLRQTSRELEEYIGDTVGHWGDGHKYTKQLTVVNMKSLPIFLRHDIPNFEVIIMDECHRVKSSTIFDNIFKVPGVYRIGMSGTPLSKDVLSDLKLVAATGDVIYEITNDFLINEG